MRGGSETEPSPAPDAHSDHWTPPVAWANTPSLCYILLSLAPHQSSSYSLAPKCKRASDQVFSWDNYIPPHFFKHHFLVLCPLGTEPQYSGTGLTLKELLSVESDRVREGRCVLGPSKKEDWIRHTVPHWMGASDHKAVACTHQAWWEIH